MTLDLSQQTALALSVAGYEKAQARSGHPPASGIGPDAGSPGKLA
jgi:hypothetical protein